jgi:phytoene dehydrogenase-like protein
MVLNQHNRSMSNELLDAAVVGSGPNGLAAAVVLALAGRSVLVLEQEDLIGGGTRTSELTLPGFSHDVCSAVHPMGALSPLFRRLPLGEHGLEWIRPPVSVAHPFDDGTAGIIAQSLDETGDTIGRDAQAWRRLVGPFLRAPHELFEGLLGPLRFPAQPIAMARFGFLGLRSARGLSRRYFSGERAQALFAGCAGHSVLPLDKIPSAAVGLVFAISAHVEAWPVARGGSRAITAALASLLRSLGGSIETGRRVSSMTDIPDSRAVLFDLAPTAVARIAGDALPAGYRNRLGGYRYGPGAFKLDWALDGPIPWRAKECLRASTVHVGGTMAEIALAEADAWLGRVTERPFLIVAQQSQFDDSRAPAGKHTGYAYCHVPGGSTVDMTDRIEAQMERFAPGFRDLVLARHITTPVDFERYNPNYVGGAITGGAADLAQLFTRPVTRLNPYTTPNPRLFLCSASTPPGGGVHGMCGYHGAQAALHRVLR